MNDVGAEEPIRQAADDVEPDAAERAAEKELEEERHFTDPGRWWFASTACPLIAGTFGPIASAFSICALAQYWRVYVPPSGASEISIKDPAWLVAINALSLISALAGNGSLLLNMGRRLRFSIAQPMTITGFLLAAILLIADMAALTSSPSYRLSPDLDLTYRGIQNPANHALSSAFYYAVIAAIIYVIITALMCLTVYGANAGHYDKELRLTAPQRTLMLQTMLFFAYLLLGALVFSSIEQWEYLDAVYWADTTLLTVGMGDYSPATHTGRSLLFPFAIGGILIIGLVVGSIRSLVLERGEEKLSARITEKKRATAVDSVNGHSIRVSWFTRVEFDDKHLSRAERRQKEFSVMRQVQDAAERERRWMALTTSMFLALLLWFIGAVVFMTTERIQGWSYFQSLYFAYTSLLTIGYGDFSPTSHAGKPFFVFWSLLAVPALTILISNMGDTIIKTISETIIQIGEITVLPGEHGIRAGAKIMANRIMPSKHVGRTRITPPGIFGDIRDPEGTQPVMHDDMMMDRVAERVTSYLEEEELNQAAQAADEHDDLNRDIHFYHYVLAREVRNVMKDLSASPPRKYEWGEWEYFLRIMGNQDDPDDFEGQRIDDILVPETMRILPLHDSSTIEKENPKNNDNYDIERPPKRDHKADDDFTWLSDTSPLMGTKSESEWIVERLSAALERELNRQRKGHKRRPPVTYADMIRRGQPARGQSGRSESETEVDDARNAERRDGETGKEMVNQGRA